MDLDKMPISLLGYEVEIQEKQPDGTWVSLKAPRTIPVKFPDLESRIPDFTGENGNDVLPPRVSARDQEPP